jgi:hypothetical protein
MNPRLLELFHQQRASGYADVAGAHASATIPLSDRLVTTFVQEQLPPAAPVRELDIRAHAGNRFSVRVRLSRPALLPPISLNLFIEEQPQLPDRPIVVLRMASGGGLFSLAGSAMRFLNVLPAGIDLDGDRIAVDLRALLEQRGLGEVMEFLQQLEVSTEEGRFVIALRGGLPGSRDSREQR